MRYRDFRFTLGRRQWLRRLLFASPCLLLGLSLGCGTGEYESRLNQNHPVGAAAAANPAPANQGGAPVAK